MSFRAIFTSRVAMDAKVKLRPPLNYRFVERGEDNVVLVIKVWNGHHQEALVLGGVTARYGSVLVRSLTVGLSTFRYKEYSRFIIWSLSNFR